MRARRVYVRLGFGGFVLLAAMTLIIGFFSDGDVFPLLILMFLWGLVCLTAGLVLLGAFLLRRFSSESQDPARGLM